MRLGVPGGLIDVTCVTAMIPVRRHPYCPYPGSQLTKLTDCFWFALVNGEKPDLDKARASPLWLAEDCALFQGSNTEVFVLCWVFGRKRYQLQMLFVQRSKTPIRVNCLILLSA